MIEINYLDFLKMYPYILEQKIDPILIDHLRLFNQKKILRIDLCKLTDLIVGIKNDINNNILKNNVILLN